MYDTIVIGAGPAGMMASIKASENKHSVLLIEKNDRIGKKLYITGGGRCNLTNLKDNNDFIRKIPVNNKFLYSALSQFGPHEIYNYFKNGGILLKIEDNDRVFPVSNRSQTIIDFLYKKMVSNKVDIHFNESVKKIINPGKKSKEILTNIGTYKASKVIIATGGNSYSQTGSSGAGYNFCKELNQPLVDIYPAETFLVIKGLHSLSGVTLDNVSIKFEKYNVSGPILFTHFGISGPTVFQISEKVYHKLKETQSVNIYIDLIPDYSKEELMDKINNYDSQKELNSFVREYLPKSVTNYIIDEKDLNQRISFLSSLKKQSVVDTLKNFKLEVKATGDIEQSLVTGGGVDLKYINPKTMESTINPGIHFVGELLDVHGHTGGYNITIALSTGYAAGLNREIK